MKRKKINYFFTPISVFFFLSLLWSCSLIFLPESYDVIEGEYCLVFITTSDIDSDEFHTICIQGDMACEQVIELTGLEFTQKIPIIYEPSHNEEVSHQSIAHVNSFSVYLYADFFTYSSDERIKILQHEITHVITGVFFGGQNLFIFNEGIAVYIEENMMLPEASVLRTQIDDYIDFTYFDYDLNYDYYDDNDLISPLYRLCGEFAGFWCETYGMENFFLLFKEAYVSNVKEIIEKYGNGTYEEIINDFIQF